MFHSISVVINILILPLFSIILSIIINKTKQQQYNILDIIKNWFIFWSLGIRLILAGVIQIFNPKYTDNLLQLGLNNFSIIQELGIANITIGTMCIVSFFKTNLQKYVCFCSSFFWLGLSINHILNLKSFNDTFSLITDVVLMTISLYFFLHLYISDHSFK